MDAKRRILVLHDGDLIGRAVVCQLEAAQTPVREIDERLPADELVDAAFGCRAVVAVGDRFAADPAVLSAANMPGVRSLVLVVRGASDFASGRLVLDGHGDAPLALVAADDAAACAIAAIDHDDYCGRIVEVAAPGDFTVSAVAAAIARARGRRLKVSAWPRWVIAGMRALGRAPFRLPSELTRPRSNEDVTRLHPAPWRTVEQVAAPSVERSEDHAMGVH